MTWAVPEHSRGQVNRAGATMVDPAAPPEATDWAREVVNNWRAAHEFPLNHLQIRLRRYVSPYGDAAFIAHRLKRLSSIEGKLRRHNRMNLSQMHDIGGCRAVLPTVHEVHDVVQKYETGNATYKCYDYLEKPQATGYRGIHIVPSYPEDGSNPQYQGMKIEIQLRTHLQHIWSTTVESVGTFTDQNLKAGSGSKEWLRFFALMGSYMAQKENLPLVPDTPRIQSALRNAISNLALHIDAIAKLEAYGEMAKIMKNLETTVKKDLQTNFSYFHIRIKVQDDDSAQVRWRGYSRDQWHKAMQAYEETEKRIHNVDREETVLVRASSVEDLQRAYPNYFANTRMFVEELRQAIS